MNWEAHFHSLARMNSLSQRLSGYPVSLTRWKRKLPAVYRLYVSSWFSGVPLQHSLRSSITCHLTVCEDRYQTNSIGLTCSDTCEVSAQYRAYGHISAILCRYISFKEQLFRLERSRKTHQAKSNFATVVSREHFALVNVLPRHIRL